jgi:hypothetical protein
MPTETLTYEGELTVLTCWCGTRHAVPSELRRFQLRQHDNGENVTSIYCPLGHTHVPSGRSKAVAEREKREQLERQLANRDEDLRAERAAHAATKVQATKLRKRAEAGACPCCNRSFVQLARHIKTKHPEFQA